MAAIDEILKHATKYAPALASALTGNLAPAVLTLLGEVFNTNPEADAISAAMRSSDPEVIKANLSRAEAAFRADAERSVAVQKQIDANVEMMKMNLDRGIFYSGWRPLAGWAAALFYISYAGLILFEGFQGIYLAIAHVGQVSMIGVPIMALAGIVAWQRSEERKAISGGGAALQELSKQLLGKA